MYPLLTFGSLALSTSIFLDLVCLALAPFVVYFALRGRLAFWRGLVLAVGVAIAGWVGARLFHVMVERPAYFLDHPGEILTSFEGMTFYGALGLGALAFFLGLRWLVPRAEHPRMRDLGAVVTACCYGILRVGCFADGCCWGRICGYPWAVRYLSPDSEMPYRGIPVHPVQLYDAFAGFLLAAILLQLPRAFPRLRGQGLWVFALLYPIARMLTEGYRGDAYRGVGLFLGMSTSQLISAALFLAAAVWATSHWLPRHAPSPRPNHA